MHKKNRLVLFTFQFPYGEQETFLENEIAYLSQDFSEITIVPLFSAEKLRAISCENVKVQKAVFAGKDKISFVQLCNLKVWYYFIQGILEIGISKTKIIKVIKQAIIINGLKNYLKENQSLMTSDLWYFYWGTNSVNVLPFLKNHPKAVARFHRFDLYDKDIDGGEHQVFRKQMFERLTRALMITQDGVNYFQEKFQADSPPMHLSRLGVPDRGIGKSSTDTTLRIVSCSNFYHVKRVDIIASALATMNEVKIHWVHFGDGIDELKNAVLEITKKFPSNISFEFMGRRSNHEVMEYYKNQPIDLFLNVSLSEGLPVSIMEALSFGIPVMATKCGGVGVLINENNGKLLGLHISALELASELNYFYLNRFKDEGLRNTARQSWGLLVDSDKNYHEFCDYLNSLI